jgi:hypothetical protein
MRDQVTSFYGHVPQVHRELFTVNTHQVADIIQSFTRIKRQKLFVHCVPSTFQEIEDHPKYSEILYNMGYIKVVKYCGERGLGLHHLAPVVNYPADVNIPPAEPSVQWDGDCPMLVKRFHYERAYHEISHGLNNYARSLHFIRQKVEGVPQAVDIGHGTGFFNGNDSILTDFRSLSQIQNPLESPQTLQLFSSLQAKCPQLNEYSRWAGDLEPTRFVDIDPSHVQLFADIGSSFTQIELGVKLISLLGLG